MKPISKFDQEFHEGMAFNIHFLEMTGQMGNARMTDHMFRVSWICPSPACLQTHSAKGTLLQCISTAGAVTILGASWATIRDEGLAQEEDQDEAELATTSEHLADFLKKFGPT